MAKAKWWVLVSLALWVLGGSSGCRTREEPKIRIGSYPTPTWGMTFADPCHLGQHGYGHSLSERNGIVYTARAGHIDLAHVRSCADWTRYLYDKTKTCLLQEKTDFFFKSNIESTQYHIHIRYPDDWADRLPKERQAIIQEVAIEAGQYLTFTAATWHEILTWYGLAAFGFFPEYPSAFSWEDSFSNLLGVRLAGQVLKQDPMDYDKGITHALEQELQVLGIQSRTMAEKITVSLRGQWYSGTIPGWVAITRRNFDIGLDDGRITPTLVPNEITGLNEDKVSYPVPSLTRIMELGFTIDVVIVPKEWIKYKILRVVYPGTSSKGKIIRPSIHFPKLLQAIEHEAQSKGMSW